MRLVFPVAATHLHHPGRVRVGSDARLRKLHDLAVVYRHETRRTHEVGLSQPAPGHGLVVVGIAEEGPGQLELPGAPRDQLAHRQGVRLLLDDQVRPQRGHHHRVLRKLAHRIEQRRIAQAEVVDQRFHVGVVVGFLLLAAPGDERAVAAGDVHLDFRRLVGAEQAEAHEEHVQQARVIGILDVLEHQLPVGGDELARVAEEGELAAVEDAVVQCEHRGPEVLFEGLEPLSERREDHAVTPRNAELSESMVLRIEIRRHAPLLLHAAAERHTDEIALQVVCPLVIRAHELGRVAEVPLAELHSSMGAAVLDDVDRAILVAHHDDRLLADERPLEIAGPGKLGF